LATGAGADGTGVTVAGPGETGGVTFVWLLAVQKTTATATSTTPPSKTHNQRDMVSPWCRSGPSPMMGDLHLSVEFVGRAVARYSPSSICHGARMTPIRAPLDARRQKPTPILLLTWRPAAFGGPPPHPVVPHSRNQRASGQLHVLAVLAGGHGRAFNFFFVGACGGECCVRRDRADSGPPPHYHRFTFRQFLRWEWR
jgi:hypothetical protein